jgi:nucleoside-diphosphate-sugar epimerase
MNVIAFGGTGWVGHHIVRQFCAAGAKVTVCSRGVKNKYADEMPPGVEMRQGDKSSAEDMEKILSEREYEVVVDSVPTEASIDNIVKFARGLRHYIHCSSTGGYAPLPSIPGDETMPYDHFMGGWKQKAIVDAKVMDLHHREGFPATVIRPCYITGPGYLPLDNLGGRREDFISDLFNGVTLDLPNDGQALLQPIHVIDLARSFLLSAQKPRSIGQIYNICLEKSVTIKRYVEINAEAVGKKADINLLPLEEMRKKYESKTDDRGLCFFATHMCYDISKAKEQLGYEPHISTEEAIRETARWALAQSEK